MLEGHVLFYSYYGKSLESFIWNLQCTKLTDRKPHFDNEGVWIPVITNTARTLRKIHLANFRAPCLRPQNIFYTIVDGQLSSLLFPETLLVSPAKGDFGRTPYYSGKERTLTAYDDVLALIVIVTDIHLAVANSLHITASFHRERIHVQRDSQEDFVDKLIALMYNEGLLKKKWFEVLRDLMDRVINLNEFADKLEKFKTPKLPQYFDVNLFALTNQEAFNDYVDWDFKKDHPIELEELE